MKMDSLKFCLSWVLILVICSGSTNAACGSNCLNNTVGSAALACNETTGECLYGCIAGYTGLLCVIPCGNNCLSCIVSPESENDTECSQCAPNHFKYESGCDVCNNNCQGNTSSNVSVCNHDDGSCLDGCIDYYYGDKCEKHCGHLCVDSVCHRDGTCSRGCRFNFYGPRLLNNVKKTMFLEEYCPCINNDTMLDQRRLNIIMTLNRRWFIPVFLLCFSFLKQ